VYSSIGLAVGHISFTAENNSLILLSSSRNLRYCLVLAISSTVINRAPVGSSGFASSCFMVLFVLENLFINSIALSNSYSISIAETQLGPTTNKLTSMRRKYFFTVGIDARRIVAVDVGFVA